MFTPAPSDVMFILGILGIMFAIYRYFRDPQIKANTSILLISEQLKDLNSQLINLRDNHLHSLDLKIENANKNISFLSIEITRLSTIIEERIPRK